MGAEQFYTYREIMQQPEVWLKEYDSIVSHRKEISDFIGRYAGKGYEVVFTGAGTSAYIGDMLVYLFSDLRFSAYRAVPTTDIVTHGRSLFIPGRKILLVSFARSGNSPESIAGDNPHNTLLLLLPPETNDLSLAMTSSFSTMAMAAIMAFHADNIEAEKEAVENVSSNLRKALEKYVPALEAVAQKEFHRAVFLGSAALKGIAEESHLKLQELTDGAVMCTFDSFLGFRHGPKAVVKEDALLVYLLSDDPHVRKYETDLIRQVNSVNKVAAQVLVSSEPVDVEGVDFDVHVVLNPDGLETDGYGYVPYVFVAQMLGFFKSIFYGLSPDAPSKSGNIHRVVEGVTISE